MTIRRSYSNSILTNISEFLIALIIILIATVSISKYCADYDYYNYVELKARRYYKMTRSKSQKYIYLCRYNKSKPYRVIIRHNGENIQVGTFATFPEAIEARNKKLQELGARVPIGPLTRVGIKASIRRSIEDLELVAKSIKNIDRVSFNIVSNQIEQLSKMLNKY